MRDEGSAGGYTQATYGDAFADVYDEWYSDVSDVEATVTLIAELAGDQQVLELGVGTGRLALPLAERGIDIMGLDASAAMLERLHGNDPADMVLAELGDMAALEYSEAFGVVFVAFNTLFNLGTAIEQRQCFEGVARALRPSGCFVVEAIAPDVCDISQDRAVTPRLLDNGGVVLNVTITNIEDQVVRGQQVEVSAEGEVTLRPWRIRYCSVAELDEMAAAAGLCVERRWQDWARTPFSDRSTRHVTIYRLPR